MLDSVVCMCTLIKYVAIFDSYLAGLVNFVRKLLFYLLYFPQNHYSGTFLMYVIRINEVFESIAI